MTKKYQPIQGKDLGSIVTQLNRNFNALDKEVDSKSWRGSHGETAMTMGKLPNDNGYGMLINDTNGTPNIWIATNSSGNPVAKIARTGIDVTTATDAQLLFDGSRDVLQVVGSGSRTIVVSTGTVQTVSIPHNLGYTPHILGYLLEPGSTTIRWPLPFLIGSGATTSYAQASVDPTNVNLWTASTNGTYSFQWILLKQSLS